MQTKKKVYLTVIMACLTFSIFLASMPMASAASMWSKTYGGTAADTAAGETVQSSDGGYAILGDTNSFGAGGNDIWLVKTDPLGVVPEGSTIGVMLLLSTIAVIVSLRYFRKRPKTENFSQVKL
jgi:hypothetical protein